VKDVAEGVWLDIAPKTAFNKDMGSQSPTGHQRARPHARDDSVDANSQVAFHAVQLNLRGDGSVLVVRDANTDLS
jgi:hypothetical protein